MQDHLKSLLLTLRRHRVRFVVCGGVAAVLQGVERMTVDLDIAVDLSQENVVLLLAAMDELKLEPRVPVPATSLLDPAKIAWMVREKNALVFTFIDPSDPYRQIDVFLAPEFAYDALIDRTEAIDMDGVSLPVLSRAELLRMKKEIDPPRDKDVLDIHALERLIAQSGGQA